MKFDGSIPVYGDQSFQGECPSEALEMMTIFNYLRETPYGAIAIHPRNEGQLRGGQFSAMARRVAEGQVKGAADVIIPASPAFVCEVKRRDHTKSTWQTGQREYLQAAQRLGAFACVALGFHGFEAAFKDWARNGR